MAMMASYPAETKAFLGNRMNEDDKVATVVVCRDVS
jgi:hypothetical protein